MPKILFFQQLRTQESLFRSMEPGIKGKGTNKSISVHLSCGMEEFSRITAFLSATAADRA
ncbi:hypothetical protein AMQ84_05370 [Paenibacillus riograndensis]|uniref:Uncharacterized protein n=1 Tax=Paenibacillus riograndensis TaxID=483937 RepID=A0A132U8V4_9BACL|nr:hypothetical protein AMQ84_05370 [Paenibacillus riograndensis]